MMVTFVSQCQKKALNRTRRVLDAFANRIGSNTWQTVITEDGLVSRRTGGLESQGRSRNRCSPVSRRTGGLEMSSQADKTKAHVSRRTGGLENNCLT
jgi:hypothetical protein